MLIVYLLNHKTSFIKYKGTKKYQSNYKFRIDYFFYNIK